MSRAPLTEIGFRAMAETITRLRRRNKDLSTRLVQVEQSRDRWRATALDRSRQIGNLRDQVRRWKARAPVWQVTPQERRRVMGVKRSYGAEEWETHERILERILSIPPRDIL